MRWTPGGAVIAAFATFATASAFIGAERVGAAPNFPDVTVRVTVLEIEDLGDDLDSTSDADFYTIVGFDDHVNPATTVSNEDTDTTDEVEGEEHIHPNWETEFTANPSQGQVDVTLEVKDEDGGLNFDDDTADVIAGGVIRAAVDLRPCRIVIEGIARTCGMPMTYAAGDEVVFKIDVLLPTSTPGLRIQCLQDPVWPSPGQAVTITATALDGAANALAAVDTMAITYNGVQVASAAGAPTVSYSFIANSSEFWYECTAEDQGGEQQATTTPRMVRVGELGELAAPIVYTGPSHNRIDIVILADRDSYTGFTDATFLDHVHDVLLEMPGNPAAQQRGYFANEYVLSLQKSFNLWIARVVADADNVPTDDDCTLQAPENWDRYAFADAGWILHADDFRDCADFALKLFSSEQDEPGTSVHETGHSPFGLADEYCCDGGHWQDPVRPNVYVSAAACQSDAATIGVAPAACRVLGSGSMWWTSDPVADVMNGDRTTFNPLDRRRWGWLTSTCTTTGGC